MDPSSLLQMIEPFCEVKGTAPNSLFVAPLLVTSIDTPLGPMLAIVDDTALFMLEFTDRTHLRRQIERLARMQNRAINIGRTKITDQIETELSDYFAGRLTQFSTPVVTSGTAFQTRIWDALRRIPYGETHSYGELASLINQPKASRAVGGANGRNGLALIIPCHRVIAQDGTIGGYAGGTMRKRRLLALEQGQGAFDA